MDELEALLQEAHDLLDNENNMHLTPKLECRYCTARGYDGNGLIHLDTCILMRIRRTLHPMPVLSAWFSDVTDLWRARKYKERLG